ncbi:ComEC/Rec2 family competence protein [Cyanobium sp. WAJ14-Wanaka]|uniref:ComEC/Rec2 family competence protein n=1 Tax=Cyanobium sp. WAJ14-Wanaka TaxID=2823725 RepID=UPI0020CF0E79|nr:ComEC/Rec2 family competence protein [Cyanobium sp. WAJ14-Wanaka]MCP9774070.1 ComEC/Rec2 family competence protein [Cyanobium sp. WAJ14-Wanaka]
MARGGRRHWLWLALVALLLLRIGLIAFTPARPGPGDPVHGANPSLELTLEGRLLADPSAIGDGQACRALLQLPAGRTELRMEPCPQLQEGWRLRVHGLLRRPMASPHPLLAAPAERLARQQTFSQMKVQNLEVLHKPASPVADLRRRMAQALLERAGAANGGVLAALVLGSAVVPLPGEVRDAFRAAGLSHALAASGFHLSVLLGAVMPLGRRLVRPLRLGLALGAMALFVLLAGPQPSVLRAVLMGAIALVVLECGWRARPLGILFASLLALLVVFPQWLLDVGFQLSAVATAALMVSARPMEEGLKRWLPPVAAAALAVPLAASFWTLPLQLLHFGVVPIYAVPANVVVAPLLTPLTLGAMALALVAILLPPLLPLLLIPVAWLCGLLLVVVRWFAGLPMAQWQLGRPTHLLVLLLVLAVLAVAIPGLAKRWRWLGAALISGVMVVQLGWLASDQLLLVHQGRLDLLVARHQGRAALVSLQGDGFSCLQAQSLAKGLGVQRWDWSLLLDPLPAANTGCWRQESNLVVASGEGSPPLLPGEQLRSPGLVAEPLASFSRAVRLKVGGSQWLLLPDRQALWSWRDQVGIAGQPATSASPAIDGVWLGFRPQLKEQRWLELQGVKRVWLSGRLPLQPKQRWAATGASGSLQAALA